MIRRRKRKYDDPLFHPDHPRPKTRREFLGQGFIMGGAGVLGSSSLLLGNRAQALAPDLAAMVDTCGIATQGAGKIPFICFDLAGGSNQAGSNVLVGQQGGQLDFLSTQGYERQGLPAGMVPPIVNPDTQTNDNIDQRLGLAFHADSAFLRGMEAGECHRKPWPIPMAPSSRPDPTTTPATTRTTQCTVLPGPASFARPGHQTTTTDLQRCRRRPVDTDRQ